MAVGEPGDLPEQLAKHGIDRPHLLAHRMLDAYSPQYWGDGLAQLIAGVRPDVVLAAGTARGAEVMAWAAARCGVPLATDCSAIRPGESWGVTRERGGGSLLEDAELLAPVRLCTRTPGAVPTTVCSASATADVAVHGFTPDLDAAAPHATVVERRRRTAGVSLATAPVGCLVDSGAVNTLMPAWPADLAGVDCTGAPVTTLGLGGSEVQARLVPTVLAVGDHRWEAEVGFCDPWVRSWGLLGQRSFFRYFVVTFRTADFELEIEPDRR